MARTIHERFECGWLNLGPVSIDVHYHDLYIAKPQCANVLQLHHRVLCLHHERLDPDHRHLPRVHALRVVVDNLDVFRPDLRRHHLILVVYVQRRHLLRTVELQGLRSRPDLLQLHPSCGTADPDDTHQTAHPSLHKSASTRSFLE